jgi:uncharacterized protein (DUF2235 family)
MKRIVICADGTWDRPEEDLKKDFPTNVLRVARGVKPVDSRGVEQIVFYDWGVGSYYEPVKGGAFGNGINKNIQDGYRFIVQNYKPGDDLYFFGFSRGAYTVRSLAGFIYNCGILKREHARLIQKAFDLYKDRKIHPESGASIKFREKYSVRSEIRVKFVGAWETVGALGIPFRVFGFLNDKHHFHDAKIGPNILHARHALALDELRDDFKPTIWKVRPRMDLKQVWFAGAHADVGGGYGPDARGRARGKFLSDIPLEWMLKEAESFGLRFERHLKESLKPDPSARQHNEYKGFYKMLGKWRREIPEHTTIHRSVKKRFESRKTYRPKPLRDHLDRHGWGRLTD